MGRGLSDDEVLVEEQRPVIIRCRDTGVVGEVVLGSVLEVRVSGSSVVPNSTVCWREAGMLGFMYVGVVLCQMQCVV